MSKTFLDRLDGCDHPTLKEIIDYVAESDCADGDRPPVSGCDCVCCKAELLRRKLWPMRPTVLADVLAKVLEVVDDARCLYSPGSLVRLGLPTELVDRISRPYDSRDLAVRIFDENGDSIDGVNAVLGLELIEALAEELGIDRKEIRNTSAGNGPCGPRKPPSAGAVGLAPVKGECD